MRRYNMTVLVRPDTSSDHFDAEHLMAERRRKVNVTAESETHARRGAIHLAASESMLVTKFLSVTSKEMKQ